MVLIYKDLNRTNRTRLRLGTYGSLDHQRGVSSRLRRISISGQLGALVSPRDTLLPSACVPHDPAPSRSGMIMLPRWCSLTFHRLRQIYRKRLRGGNRERRYRRSQGRPEGFTLHSGLMPHGPGFSSSALGPRCSLVWYLKRFEELRALSFGRLVRFSTVGMPTAECRLQRLSESVVSTSIGRLPKARSSAPRDDFQTWTPAPAVTPCGLCSERNAGGLEVRQAVLLKLWSACYPAPRGKWVDEAPAWDPMDGVLHLRSCRLLNVFSFDTLGQGRRRLWLGGGRGCPCLTAAACCGGFHDLSWTCIAIGRLRLPQTVHHRIGARAGQWRVPPGGHRGWRRSVGPYGRR